MNPGILIMMLFGLVVVVGVTVMVPEISRPTVPLGVDIPRERVADPVVTGAIRRYRWGCLAAGVIALAGTLLTMDSPAANALWLLGYVAASMVVFALCRGPIVRAKAEQGWYDGVQVRLSATLTPDAAEPRVRWGLHVTALAILLAAAAWTAWVYPALPDPLPTHWDAAGQVNGWAPKSWASALMLPLIGLGTVATITLAAWLVARQRGPHLPDGDPETARRTDLARRNALQVALGWTAVGLALGMAALAALPLVRVSPALMMTATWAMVAASLVPMIWLVADTVRRQRIARNSTAPRGPESPDDDRHWKAGLFYYNPADPRFMVPKRNGIGLEPNAGHPGGMIFYLCTLAVLVWTVWVVVTIPR